MIDSQSDGFPGHNLARLRRRWVAAYRAWTQVANDMALTSTGLTDVQRAAQRRYRAAESAYFTQLHMTTGENPATSWSLIYSSDARQPEREGEGGLTRDTPGLAPAAQGSSRVTDPARRSLPAIPGRGSPTPALPAAVRSTLPDAGSMWSVRRRWLLVLLDS
jgi:hypothetical protein